MKREIRFRGRTPQGEWLYGDLQQWNDDTVRIAVNNDHWSDDGIQSSDYLTILEVNTDTVGQFTGLYDKNGKMIFDGDIVRTKYGRPCEVKWLSTPCFVGFDLSPKIAFSKFKAPDHYDLYAPENLEVIGNIYDNPKLLQEEL